MFHRKHSGGGWAIMNTILDTTKDSTTRMWKQKPGDKYET